MIERNGYWAHPEAILLAMLADADDAVRQQAVSWILRCRKEERDELRPFQLPVINFDAEHYTQLINWSQVHITEPPLTSSLSGPELRSIGESMSSSVPVFESKRDFCLLVWVRRSPTQFSLGWSCLLE